MWRQMHLSGSGLFVLCVKLVVILSTLTQFNSKLNSRRLNYTRQRHPAVHADCHYASLSVCVCPIILLAVSPDMFAAINFCTL